MVIRITKGRDGPNILTCVRSDGSATWAKVQDYFPIHDLTHYVVETTLKIDNAFYSLVRDGWDITDFAVKGAGKRLPPEANLVEALVSRLQQEVMPGVEFTTEAYNEEVLAVLEGIGNPARRLVSDEELLEMRSRLKDLLTKWRTVLPGGVLELTFPE